jgi:hypothetical protein
MHLCGDCTLPLHKTVVSITNSYRYINLRLSNARFLCWLFKLKQLIFVRVLFAILWTSPSIFPRKQERTLAPLWRAVILDMSSNRHIPFYRHVRAEWKHENRLLETPIAMFLLSLVALCSYCWNVSSGLAVSPVQFQFKFIWTALFKKSASTIP